LDGAREIVHGTAIALQGRAALIRGASGSGKSDLALRCVGLASPLIGGPVRLVSDDQVVLAPRGGRLFVSPPPPIRGLIEVRGIGVLPVPNLEEAELVLVADLVATGACERLPDPEAGVVLLGHPLQRLDLAPFEGSAALKLLLALQAIVPRPPAA
jgi:serine kinase of HPr protein (carbohydrate metabolism regulator)